MNIRKSLTADQIDLDDLLFWAMPLEDREGAFHTLREERPIPFFREHEIPGFPIETGPGFWCLTRHEHVLLASRTPEIFSSARGATSIPDLPSDFNEFFGGMINMDDPRHARQRRIVSRGFTPRALARLEASVQSRAATIIDRVIEKGACDFVADIAAPLPLEIICDLMGIPADLSAMVFEQTNIILGIGDPEFTSNGEDAMMAIMGAGANLAQLMRDLAEEHRRRPKDDLTSALLDASQEDGALTDEELCSFFILLVVAGNETTRNSISHGMKALCDYPDERARWAADFDGMAKTAVEEIIRWASPVIHMRRTCTQDTVVGGQKMAAGDKVVLWYNSANRDDAVFRDPYRFDVGRTPNEHVGFGGPGPHFCLGANLARREILVMFREIFRRLPDLEITGEPNRLVSYFINGIKRMPCEFTPGRVARVA
ncbi:MAG TPA: cytochrome P450 [Candidatus Limnocylindrales bacterium]|nr:cytochrome P450 [Candidatus Limnocylindrales bacterium]